MSRLKRLLNKTLLIGIFLWAGSPPSIDSSERNMNETFRHCIKRARILQYQIFRSTHDLQARIERKEHKLREGLK